MVVFILCVLAVPAQAIDYVAPSAPAEAQKWMPEETENFGDGVRSIIRSAMTVIEPSVTEALGICVSLVAVAILAGISVEIVPDIKNVVQGVGIALSVTLLFQPVNSLIYLGTDTVEEISQYGKILLPVMTGALAAQGAVNKSGALYIATAFFDAVLTTAISELLLPLVYFWIYLKSLSIC